MPSLPCFAWLHQPFIHCTGLQCPFGEVLMRSAGHSHPRLRSCWQEDGSRASVIDAWAGSSPGSQISAPPHRANCGKSAKQGLEPQLCGVHGERRLEVPWLSAVPGGLWSWACPMPRARWAVKAGIGS